jgi:hypothetical protein
LAGLDARSLGVELYSATEPVPTLSAAQGTNYDQTNTPLWFEGFAPNAIARQIAFKDVTVAKGKITEVVDVAQAHSAVTASLIYAGKTVGTQTVQAADGGRVPITVGLTARGRKLLRGKGSHPKHKARVTLLTTVTPAAGAPPPARQHRKISLTF